MSIYIACECKASFDNLNASRVCIRRDRQTGAASHNVYVGGFQLRGECNLRMVVWLGSFGKDGIPESPEPLHARCALSYLATDTVDYSSMADT